MSEENEAVKNAEVRNERTEGDSGRGLAEAESMSVDVTATDESPAPKKKTLIVFSDDLDKAIAAFTIATGAAAMGDDVTMFFTFWGLNILRRPERIAVKKGFVERAFGALMPRGARRLALSKMNFLGIGPGLMNGLMRKKGVKTLPELIELARGLGVKMVACTMSMDVMGIKKEELVDRIELAGVASYLLEADEANVNLFIG